MAVTPEAAAVAAEDWAAAVDRWAA